MIGHAATILCTMLAPPSDPGPPAPDGWKAGTATVAITPERPTWMAGYAARESPSEGKVHDLWAKALALEDPEGTRAVLVTLDLCGIGRDLSTAIRAEIGRRHGLTTDRIVLACSHTHSGPVVGTNLVTMYPLDAEQKERIADYTERLVPTVADLVGEALGDLADARLAWGVGHASFAVNRRENDQDRADELRASLSLNGPVDHDVPVLRIDGPDGALRGVVFGYACHCTTLAINQFSGDYAGFAMLELEREHPEAVAYYVAGCGGDQNPLPRRSVPLAEGYGRELASTVERTLDGPLRPVVGELRAAYEETTLAFAEIPGREHWEEEVCSDRPAVANRAKVMLAMLDDKGAIPTTYPYPVQVWRLGDLSWIFLGGEVVVEYALRIKRNLGPGDTFVAAYCNDVMAYIPSRRVLLEGGYEGATSMIYYGRPAPWAVDVEERVIEAVARLVRRLEVPIP